MLTAPSSRRVSPSQLLAFVQRLAQEPATSRGLRLDPERRTWARLSGPGRSEAWLIGWPPGTRTGWHDHGGSHGAFAVVRGSLDEFTPTASAEEREDDRIPLPPEGLRRKVLARSDGRSFGSHHLHDVANSAPVHAVSVHAYDPPLPLMRRFRLREHVLHLESVEGPGDWS